MLKIMSDFKDELYGANMCYQADGSIGPKIDPNQITHKTENTMTYNKKSSVSSVGRKAMDQDELRMLQE
jgi:hypothetical protein